MKIFALGACGRRRVP